MLRKDCGVNPNRMISLVSRNSDVEERLRQESQQNDQLISLVSPEGSTPVVNETQYFIRSPEVRVLGCIVCILKKKHEIDVSEHFANFGASVLAIEFEFFEFWLKV